MAFDDDDEFGGRPPGWAQDELSVIEPSRAARYREHIPALDRKLQGVSDEVKAKVLRVMINSEMSPTDSGNIVAILYGHIEAVAEKVPEELRALVTLLASMVDEFKREAEIFPEVTAQVQKRVIDDATEQARELARAGVAAASVEEIERMRIRMAATTDEMLQQFLKNALAEKAAHNADVLVVRNRTITAVCAMVVLCLGFLTGGSWGSTHPFLSNGQITEMAYGRKFMEMYREMPSGMVPWVKAWLKAHPGDR